MKLARIRECLARSRSAWDPTHPFETSWFLSPRQLFACRFLLAVYLWILGIWGCVRVANGAPTTSDAVTNCFKWWPWSLVLYLSCAAFHTIRYHLDSPSLLDQPHPISHALHSFSYTIAIMSPVEVAAVCLFELVHQIWRGFSFGSSASFGQWQVVSLCGLVPMIGLFEILASRTNPMPFVHLLFISLFQMVRLLLDYTTLRKDVVVHMVVSQAIVPILVFCIVWLMIYSRKRLTELNYDDGSGQTEPRSSQKGTQDTRTEV